jgi:hypothetical protein
MMKHPADYELMSREDLIAEMKRLRGQELEIRAEGQRMVTAAVAPILAELDVVKGYLGLKMTTPEAKPGRYAS